ncbi:Tn3 family transposase, partial [Paenibacillus senegalensis]|uniref:Tn3 family transposase n=1 Tax=Paenibacillus senegalensis TaxID=1465766 RepID=UPI000287DF2E
MNTIEVLTEEQRGLFKRIPEANEEKAKQYYTFSQKQLDCIFLRRRDHNRLGFAVQLALVSYPGWPLSHYEQIPPSTMAYIAQQIHVSADIFNQYARREPTRREHLEEIRRKFGFTNFTASHHKRLVNLLYDKAWEHDNPAELMEQAIGWLRENKIILPAISTLERIVWEAMHSVENEIYSILEGSLTEEQKLQLDAMLEGKSSRTLAWIRDGDEVYSPEGFVKVAERLSYLRSLNLQVDTGKIPDSRLQKLKRISAAYDPHLYRRLRTDKKYGLLGLHLYTLVPTLVDRAISIHDFLISEFITVMSVFCRQNGGSAESYGTGLPSAFRTLFKKQYFRFRKYTPIMLKVLDFHGNEQTASLLKAIKSLKAVNHIGKRHFTVPNTELGFIPEHKKKLITDKNGMVYSYILEMAVMIEIRNQIRAGNLSVSESELHRPFEHFLSSAEDKRPQNKSESAIPLDQYLAERKQSLKNRLPLISHNTDISRSNKQVSVGKEYRKYLSLNSSLYSQLPGIHLLDLLKEVDSWTGFASRFTHASTLREPDEPERARLLSILISLGRRRNLKDAAEAASGATYRQIMNTLQWRVNEDTMEDAHRTLIQFQRNLPLAAFWRKESFTSTDVQHVPAIARKDRSDNGGGTGNYSLYRCMNEQFMIVSTHGTPYGHIGWLLGGAIDPTLSSGLHYCHASGFADRLFGLASLLNIRLVPRLLRFRNVKPYRIGKVETPPFLRTGQIDTRAIRAAGADLQRLASSIHSGTVAIGHIYAKLSSQEGLKLALREIGRIEKTLFYTDFIRSGSLHNDISRDEQRWRDMYALIRRLITAGGERESIIKTFDEHSRFVQANSLLINAIVVWNTVQLGRFVQIESGPIDPDWLKHISPLYGGHIII